MSGELNNDSILLDSLSMKPKSSRPSLASTSLTENNFGRVSFEDNIKTKVESPFQCSSISSTSSNFFQTLKSVCKSGVITVYFLTTVCITMHYILLIIIFFMF